MRKADEERANKEVLEGMKRRSRPNRREYPDRTWRYYVERWKGFIEEISDGYKLSIYDYTNDLSVREILIEIEQVLSPEGQAEFRERLSPLDARFLELTTDFAVNLIATPRELEHPVFRHLYRKVPKNMKEELRRNLEEWREVVNRERRTD